MQSAVSTDHVAATSAYRLARINGTSGNLTWEAKYPSNVLDGIPLLVVPRATQGDFLTFYPALSRSLPGEACTAIGQTLLEQSGSVLFRLDPTTGHIVWRTALSHPPSALIAAPGGRIAVLSTVPSVQLFDGATGALLSTLPLPPTSSHPVLAAGQADLFVLGDYSSAFDFDPGPGSDQPPSNRGVYISRYAF